jgi:hypothetical protein
MDADHGATRGRSCNPPSAADAGYAGVGRDGSDRSKKPIEIIMACEAGRISIGDGPCRDRTCDLGIKSPLLYQLS